MSNLTNYHSHCSFCDGRAQMEDFVREAIAQGFSSYGISSHAPLPFTTAWTMDVNDMDNYLKEFERIKSSFHNQIELYIGLEIDYLNIDHHPAIEYFQQLPLDYRIGSVHLLESDINELVDIDTSPEKFRGIVDKYFSEDIKKLVSRYYDKMTTMIETGGFDIVGHTDKISCNAETYRPGLLSEEWYKDRMQNYFTLIAQKGIMVEVNTKLYDRNGFFFPNETHFPLMCALGIPVMVNSDAHYPELINSSRSVALRLLHDAGFRTVRELHRNKWLDMPIEL